MNNQNFERLLKLPDIIGRDAVSEAEAAINRAKADAIRKALPVNATDEKTKREQKKRLAQKLARVGPRTPRPAIPALIPMSKTKWYDGIKRSIFPAPVALGRNAFWRLSDVQKIIDNV